MKKKPPPGATLIARLKEKRLQREQQPKSSEDSAQVLDVESQEIEGSSEEGVQLVSSDEQGLENTELVVRPDQGSAANLLHSSISIDDLRPSTDDYDALTEEIRLAGRFAAIGLIAQGLRLARIQQAEIHKEHYSSFEEYCRAEHQMSATYAYRLIRMARMAEKFAERTSAIESEEDPYERMLNLGHRHLMALLPLGEETVEEFLVHGVPLGVGDAPDSRVPLDKATEKQIKQALKKDGSQAETQVPSVAKRASKMLGKELPKLVSMLEQCAEWVETSPPELELAKMEKEEELKQLAERFKQASDKIFEALRSET
jgi:hypothetical protein